MESKQELRKIAKGIRDNLDIQSISTKIMLNLKETNEYQTAKVVMMYHSFGKEVVTDEILCDKNKVILLPRVVQDKLEVCRYHPDSLKCSNYGIQEPTCEPYNSLSDINVIIMPGLAFTETGVRLGYGKGFYDRFLASVPAKMLKIGLAPDALIMNYIPCDKHDQKCDIIITETRVINTKNI